MATTFNVKQHSEIKTESHLHYPKGYLTATNGSTLSKTYSPTQNYKWNESGVTYKHTPNVQSFSVGTVEIPADLTVTPIDLFQQFKLDLTSYNTLSGITYSFTSEITFKIINGTTLVAPFVIVVKGQMYHNGTTSLLNSNPTIEFLGDISVYSTISDLTVTSVAGSMTPILNLTVANSGAFNGMTLGVTCFTHVIKI